MTATFWSGFSKRINSTLKPSGTGTDHDCKLKEDCSEHDPVLLLQSTTQYDYAYISAWGKYYFVRDIVSKSNTISEYHLSEDTLATYKTYIGNTIARIIYAASAVRDPYLVDPRIQIYNSRQKLGSTATAGAIFTGNNYIMTVVSSDNNNDSTGIGVTYYLNETAMRKVRQWFSSTAVYDAIQNFFKGNKPIDGILSIKWIPYTIPSSMLDTPNPKAITIGNQSTVTGTFDNSDVVSIVKGFPLINNSTSLNVHLRYNDFRSFEPYTTGQIFLPGVGNIDLKMADWYGSGKINVSYSIEAITGNVLYMLFDDDGALIQTCQTNVAADCPLSQVSMNGGNIMTSIGTAVGGIASIALAGVTGGGSLAVAGGAAAAIAGAANTVLACNQHAMSISGGVGGRLTKLYPYIDHIEYSVDTEDPTDSGYVSKHGYPHAGTAQISLFSGYVQCDGASVSCPGNASEKEEINNYLNTGFFYE